MAYWLKILFTIPKSPVLVIVVTKRLNEAEYPQSRVGGFSFYFGNSAIPNKTS